MTITQIDRLQSIGRLNGAENAVQQENAAAAGTFGSIFQSAIDYVRETDSAKNEAEYLLATGQLDNPAELTIAATKAQIAVELMIQLRNRALDAYNELKNISA